MVRVRHSKIVTLPDDPNSPVSSGEWNADHIVEFSASDVTGALGFTPAQAAAVDVLTQRIEHLTQRLKGLETTPDAPSLDTTPPVLTLPTGKPDGTTVALAGATTDEGTGTMYVVATTTATPPTAAQVEVGQASNGTAAAAFASVQISSTGAKSLTLRGLLAGTSYYAHTMHKDASGNRSNVVTSAVFTTDPVITGDTAPPVLSSPTASATGTSTATVGVTTSEANGTLYCYVSTSSTPPTVAVVTSGASQNISTAGTKTFQITALAASTRYYAHFFHRDEANNASTIVTSPAFTTQSQTVVVVPPTLTTPTATATGSTTASVGVTTDKGPGTLHVVASESSTKPTARQIQSGQNHLGVGVPGNNLPVGNSGGNVTGGISGLTASKTYYIHFVQEHTAGYSNIVSSAAISTSAVVTGDTVAPVLSLPTAAQTGSNTGTGGATTDEANGTMSIVASTSSTPPSAANIIAGKDHLGSSVPAANASITSTGAKSIVLSGLAPSTTYYVHAVHKDAAGNISNVVTSAAFTTLAFEGTTSTYLWPHSIVGHPYSDQFFRDSDPNTYSSMTYIGQFEKEMHGPDPTYTVTGKGDGYQMVHIYRAYYTDMTSMTPNYVEIWCSQAFGDGAAGQTASQPYAQAFATRLGRLPAKIRKNLWRMQVHYAGTVANAESLGHYFSLSRANIDERMAQNKLEEVMFHEGVHATLQQAGDADGKGFEYLGQGRPPSTVDPDSVVVPAWLDAVKADNGYVTEYADFNHGEDFAESGLLCYVLLHRPDRIPPADRTAIANKIPNRLNYYRTVVFPEP